MSADMEALAKALLANAQEAKISANFDKFSKILSSPQGKAVVEALTNDGGDNLRRAAEDIQKGNVDTAKQMLSSVLATKDGAEILRKILTVASE